MSILCALGLHKWYKIPEDVHPDEESYEWDEVSIMVPRLRIYTNIGNEIQDVICLRCGIVRYRKTELLEREKHKEQSIENRAKALYQRELLKRRSLREANMKKENNH